MKIYIGKTLKYPDFVDAENIKAVELQGNMFSYRYYLEIPFNKNKSNKSLVVILKNPSSANKYLCDLTIFRVCKLAYKYNYSSVIILNLFPVRATKAKQVQLFYQSNNYISIMAKNLQFIKNCCENKDVIFAWGKNSIGALRTFPNHYNAAISSVTLSVTQNTYYVDSCTCNTLRCNTNTNNVHSAVRYPLHGLRWSNNSIMIKY